MIFLYLVFVLIFVFGMRFQKKGLNNEYLSRETTTIINGIFIITVFFSHIKSYMTGLNNYDNYLYSFISLVGQLMVTSFFFYSGYGIYESIKNKKNYMETFFKKRFIPTFINFAIAILLFIAMNLILNNEYSIKDILLAFTGYTAIGNSNWYMLAIFTIYILLIIIFDNKLKLKNLTKIIILTVILVGYIYVLNLVRDSYYVDTVLCFPMGMFYSYFKDKIEEKVSRHYYLYLGVGLLIFLALFYISRHHYNIYLYNLYAMSFILLVVLVTMKFKFKNKIMYFFGSHLFWIYILERIPMIIFKNKFNNYIYFAICFVITILMSAILKKLTDKLWKKLK